MRSLTVIDNDDKIVELADAFGLDVLESVSEREVYFYIHGMDDYIIMVDSAGRVTTYSSVTPVATSFVEGLDLCDACYAFSDIFQRIISILIGIFENYKTDGRYFNA